MHSKLLTFVHGVLAEHDCLVEAGDDQLDVLLPSELARNLGTSEEVSLTPPTSEEGIPVVYGGALLDGLIELAQGDNRFANVEISDVFARSGGMKGDLEKAIHITNGVGEIGAVRTSQSAYLLVHYRFQVQCGDIEQSGTFSFAFNEESGVSAPWLAEKMEGHSLKKIGFNGFRVSLGQLEPILEQKAKAGLQQAIQPFEALIQKQILQKRRQLERLHRRKRKDLLKPLKNNYDLPEKDDILAELELEAEAYREELLQIPSAFQVEASCEPFAAVRVIIPVTRVDYTIRLRKEQRTLTWFWNALIERFEPLLCERTGKESFQFTLADNLELYCP